MNAWAASVALSLLAAALPGAAASGASVVIYRCVAADGAVTLQNGTRCPKGMREQKRVVATPVPPVTPPRASSALATSAPAAPATANAPTVSPNRAGQSGTPTSTTGTGAMAPQAGDTAPPAGAPTGPESATTARLPPPLLYTCLTPDAQRYFGDEAESTRCAPLNAVGIDGRSAAAGEACEVVRDRCEPVPEAERCAAWAERRQVAERALTFAPEQVDAARAELDRIDAAVAGTACGR